VAADGRPKPSAGPLHAYSVHSFVRLVWLGTMSRRLRPIAAPFLVQTPAGARVRTRLAVSDRDALVLWAVGLHLGALANHDLAGRCARGAVGGDGRQERKRALTGEASSRWAGAITRTSNDQWERGRRNLLVERAGLVRAIQALERRLVVPVGGRRGGSRGYTSGAERFQKQRRLQVLKGRLARVEARLAAGRVNVCRGGRALTRTRQNLEAAGLSEGEWRRRWEAERLFIVADGEADKRWGNETIRWHPEERWLELKLPARLGFLANRPHGRYRLDCGVDFRYRGADVAAQTGGGAVRYDISYQPERARWYLDASWKLPARSIPELGQVLSGGVLGVDLNADHLAAWVLDEGGNPHSRPHTIPLALDGLAASTRDGRLRAAVSALIGLARQAGVEAIAIEDLDFVDARQAGRETMGRGRCGKRWRRRVAGLPTARFRERLVQMCANAGLWVVAVDPAYTSRWGEVHWRIPLQEQTRSSITVSRHHAAAVVIGRRSLGHRARRRQDVTAAHRRMGGRELSVRPDATPGCSGPSPAPEAAARPGRGQDAGGLKGRGGGPGHRRPFAVARRTLRMSAVEER
jgi:IS605 OrfB family transposase